jgi:hypothetical protein
MTRRPPRGLVRVHHIRLSPPTQFTTIGKSRRESVMLLSSAAEFDYNISVTEDTPVRRPNTWE